MLFQRAAAAVALAVTGAAYGQSATAANVDDFDPVGAGMTQNPCVAGNLTVISHELEPGLVDTKVNGVILGLRPFTTYDLRIRDFSGNEVVRPDAFTTGFMGFKVLHVTFEGLPFGLTDQPVVDLFIDTDGEPDNMSAGEMRASGVGGGC